MRYLSLFSGIGGFDLGFDRAGMECAGQVEIDDFCRRVLAKHWPDVPRMADIREVAGNEFGTIDLICGGFPCQPHSVAGKQRGAEDDRELWPEMRRIIANVRPAWVVAENSPNIRKTILDSIFIDLETIGYTVGAVNIPACAVDAPHIRQRAFILAHTDRTGFKERGRAKSVEPQQLPAERSGQYLAHTDESNKHGGRGHVQMGGRWQPEEATENGNAGRTQWPPEPGVGRMAYGVSRRVDRLGALGNAIVPQVAEWIGRCIIEVDGQ